MRIAAQFGSDTGMYMVDVFLESPEERNSDDEQIMSKAAVLLAEQGIDLMDVVDFFNHVQNGRGEWVSATRNADGKLVPVPW